jgi:hypothetical protein
MEHVFAMWFTSAQRQRMIRSVYQSANPNDEIARPG